MSERLKAMEEVLAVAESFLVKNLLTGEDDCVCQDCGDDQLRLAVTAMRECVAKERNGQA